MYNDQINQLTQKVIRGEISCGAYADALHAIQSGASPVAVDIGHLTNTADRNCPGCHTTVEAHSLAYDAAYDLDVCKSCREPVDVCASCGETEDTYCCESCYSTTCEDCMVLVGDERSECQSCHESDD